MTVVGFYIPETFKQEMILFKELTKVEKGYSAVLRTFIQSYNHEHNPSNPQRTITVFNGLREPADPFGCGQVFAISTDGLRVRCKKVGNQDKWFCLHHCKFRGVKNDGSKKREP